MTKSLLCALVLFVWAPCSSNAQTTLTTAPNDGRPVDTIIRQIEELSGIPISYEDLLYANPADTKDIASLVARGPVAPGTHLIVPRGGTLSVPIVVDSVTGKLADLLATSAALNTLLTVANNSPVVAGTFNLDSYDGAFFVVPANSRAANNDMTPMTPVLSTPVDLTGTQQSAYETLRTILNQVSTKTGITINIGTIPIQPFAVTETTLVASSQPASYALARLFEAISTAGGAPPGFYSMSYHAFFDPVAKYYALNIQMVVNPNPPAILPTPQPTPGVGQRLGTVSNVAPSSVVPKSK